MSASPDVAESATLAVIAGGAGTRMGTPKAWLTIAGTPILTFLLNRWSWPGPTLLVTSPARPHPPGWERFDREVSDSIADEGPLRGLLTALEAAETPILLAATCDMPMIQRDQLLWLADRLAEQSQVKAVMLGQNATTIEPFPCALRTSAIDLLRRRLESSDRSVYSLARLPEFSLLTVPQNWPRRTWTNLNCPADLECVVEELAKLNPSQQPCDLTTHPPPTARHPI